MPPKTKEPKESKTPVPQEAEIHPNDDFFEDDEAHSNEKSNDPFDRPEEESESEGDVSEGDVSEGDEIEGFDNGCDAASFGDFDPMQALGQLLVTHDGDTIPDVLVGIKQSLDTLTKVLHKMSKTLEKK